MPRRKDLNGLPHNLVKSYFSTLRYYGNGYMGDWLLNAAKKMQKNTIILDIINSRIEPAEIEKDPLLYHLCDLRSMLQKELSQKGFDETFIVEATIRVEIPDLNIYARTLYCYPVMVDKDGRKYSAGRFVEAAYEESFDPFIITARKSFWTRIKSLFK